MKLTTDTRVDAIFAAFLEKLIQNIKAGKAPTRRDILDLLEPACESPETDLVKVRARQLAREFAGNRGKVWSAVGIENRSCPMNCHFCALGEKWGLVDGDSEWTDEAILQAASCSVGAGASWFVLRTNEFYNIERLVTLARKIRGAVRGEYELVVNTGELSPEDCQRLFEGGIGGVYHTWRLGEGSTTSFKPETRLATMRVVGNSPLKLYHLVEPLGPEHSNGEIADHILAAINANAALGGAMARINVSGTPLADSGSASPWRISQVVAASRILGGPGTPDICVAPPLPEGLCAGANVLTVEMGSVPRAEATSQKNVWRGIDVGEARKMLREADYAA